MLNNVGHVPSPPSWNPAARGAENAANDDPGAQAHILKPISAAQKHFFIDTDISARRGNYDRVCPELKARPTTPRYTEILNHFSSPNSESTIAAIADAICTSPAITFSTFSHFLRQTYTYIHDETHGRFNT